MSSSNTWAFERARKISGMDDGATVIVIPHDINADVIIAIAGKAEQSKFNQIGIREAVYQAERVRLDKECERTSRKLKAVKILPEEKDSNESH